MIDKEYLTSSANASMGKKEHLISSTNILTGLSVYCTGYPSYRTGNPVLQVVMVMLIRRTWAETLKIQPTMV